jgi:hypothetical protein
MTEEAKVEVVPADARAAAEQGDIAAQEQKKRVRRPRAPRPVKKPRIVGVFRIFKDEGDGKWSDMSMDAGKDLAAVNRTLRTLAQGTYLVVRAYGVKTVKIEKVPKVTVM